MQGQTIRTQCLAFNLIRTMKCPSVLTEATRSSGRDPLERVMDSAALMCAVAIFQSWQDDISADMGFNETLNSA